MLNNNDYQAVMHEIKNSVTLLSSSLQLMEKKHPEIRSFEYWDSTSQEMQYLLTLLKELSQNSPTESLQIKPINPVALIRDTYQSFCDVITESSFQIHINFAPDLPYVLADALRMKIALTNILKNAYEACVSDGIITISVTISTPYVCIAIADNGPGLGDSDTAQLFEPFYTTKTNGTGLGLPITKQIIDGHNGLLEVSSPPEGGCVFRILLPIAQK